MSTADWLPLCDHLLARVEQDDGTHLDVPVNSWEVFERVLEFLANGHPVRLMRSPAKLPPWRGPRMLHEVLYERLLPPSTSATVRVENAPGPQEVSGSVAVAGFLLVVLGALEFPATLTVDLRA